MDKYIYLQAYIFVILVTLSAHYYLQTRKRKKYTLSNGGTSTIPKKVLSNACVKICFIT